MRGKTLGLLDFCGRRKTVVSYWLLAVSFFRLIESKTSGGKLAVSSEQLAVQVSLRDDLINAAEPLPVWPSFGGR